MYGCMDVWMYGCMDVWMYVRVYVCMCVCVCVYVGLRVYVCDTSKKIPYKTSHLNVWHKTFFCVRWLGILNHLQAGF